MWDTGAEYWVGNRRVLHRVHLSSRRRLIGATTIQEIYIASRIYTGGRYVHAVEEMYVRALRGYEKAWGLNHTSTLTTVASLGALYVA